MGQLPLEPVRWSLLSPWQKATAVTAFITLVLLGQRQQVNFAITTGYLAALVLLPVWLPALVRFRRARTLALLGLVSCGSGFWLLLVNSSEHGSDSSKLMINTVLLLGLVLTTGVVLWSRTVLPLPLVSLAYGIGLLAGVSRAGAAEDNPWKFGYSIPIIVLALSLVLLIPKAAAARRGLELGALGLLTLLSATNDSRSLFGMLTLVIILVLWQFTPQRRSGRTAIAKTALWLVGTAATIYNLGSALLLEGYLGHAAQTRSEEQIELTGSLLLGGRPEAAATFALFQHQPLGYGVGTVPNLNDLLVAKEGMAAINYDPNNGYVEKYMFGRQFELHSVLGDLWALFGIPGLVLGTLVLALMVRWIAAAVAHRHANALMLFLAVISLWNLFFGPLYTSITSMGLALGLTLMQREPAAPAAVAKP